MKSTLSSGVELTWVAPGDCDFWSTVWVSSEFRDLMTRSSWLRDEVVPCLADHCIGFFTPPQGSRFYFSAWLLNSVMNRQYDNPLIQDLYVLHEALHACTLDDFFAVSQNESYALRVNEIQVSLETECWVYLREPHWVGRTFNPLWVMQDELRGMDCSPLNDRMESQYLDLRTQARWPIHRPSLGWNDDDLWWMRRRASLTPSTIPDQLVRKYERLSEKWIQLVAPIARDVFVARANFRSCVKQGAWEEGVRQWMEFCNSQIADTLPFDHLQLSKTSGTIHGH